jgi:enterochelin esterase-like enzyme
MRSQLLVTTFVFLCMTGHVMTDDLQAQLVSPEVHADGTVTFRVRAPQAKQVQVKGLLGQPAHSLQLGERGVWEVTVGPLEPKIYSYVFEIDGAEQIDRHNRDVKKWLDLESMVEVPGTPPRLYEQTDVPHGSIHKHWYRSATTDAWRPVVVYTPPGYRAGGDSAYPVVFLLHGFGDDETAWTEVGRAHWTADNLIAQRRIEPVVIVMPYGHPLAIDRAAAFDDYSARNLGQMEADLLTDLDPFLVENYRVSEDRQRRAIVGLSMGGGQSLAIGLRHLDRFSCIGGFSSAAPQGDLAESLPELAADAPAANDRLRLLWIACGKDDFLLERNRAFIEQLKQRQLRHIYEETAGGHDWIVWRDHLASFLELSFPAGN